MPVDLQEGAVHRAGLALYRAERAQPGLDPEDREWLEWIRKDVLPHGQSLDDEALESADNVLGILLVCRELPAVVEAHFWRDNDLGKTDMDPHEGAYALVEAAGDLLRHAVWALGFDPDGAFSPVMSCDACVFDPPRLHDTRPLLPGAVPKAD